MTTYKALKGRKIKTLASDPPAAVIITLPKQAFFDDFKTSVFSLNLILMHLLLHGAYLHVDMAHFAGLVAGGVHPSPFPYADRRI